MKRYQLLVCGGTFDLLHNGHKSFLTELFSKSEKVIIGLTSDSYTANIKGVEAENFKTREKHLINFINSLAVAAQYEIVEINDTYGSLLDRNFLPEAIAATKETQSGAEIVNEKRKELGLNELPILIFEMEKAEDGDPISSTRIRNGEIDREGRLYIRPSWRNRNLILPDGLRAKFARPFGEVLDMIPKIIDASKVIAVGDVTVRKFNENKVNQFLSIVDFNVGREKKFNNLGDLGFPEKAAYQNIENPKGRINSQLFKSIGKVFKNNSSNIILIEGEEDLAVVPVILLAPLGFTVFYGQPNKGLVKVLITEKIKNKVFDLVNKFHLE